MKWSINFMHHLQLINKHRRMETLDGTGLGIAREYIDNEWGWLIFVKHSEKKQVAATANNAHASSNQHQLNLPQ